MRLNHRPHRPIGLAVLFLLLILSAGCTVPVVSAPPVSPTITATAFLPEQTSTELSTPVPPTSTTVPTPTSTPTAVPAPLTQYTLNVKFDYTNHNVHVEEDIAITNRWQDSLSSLVLDVEPNEYSGVFSLNSIVLNGGTPLTSTAFTLQKNRLEIPLVDPLVPGNQLNLSLDYELYLPAIPTANAYLRPDPFGYSERQTNLVNWYPYLAAYEPGSGWLMHDPYAFGEHEVYDAADYTVNLELTNAPAELVIAASGASAADTLADATSGVHQYLLSKARTFAISASPSYKVASQVVGNTTVFAYSFPWDANAGAEALKDTAKALELYNQIFGPYERTTLSVVEADFLDGMEYDGLYFLSNGFYNLYDGTPAGYLTAIAVHETSHQWWYGKVGSDQAIEPWLDEAMATYSEALFYENVYPDQLDWWQSIRVDFFDPQGFINLPVSSYPTYDQYRNGVYLNGALFLQALRNLVGDEAFFAFIKDYATRFAYQRVTTGDFFSLLKQHTSADLSPLLSEYFDPTIYP